MNTEFEAKFPNTKHNLIRKQLLKMGATIQEPMRLFKRVVIHTREMSEKNAFVRVRDEGSKVTITYKQFNNDSVDGAKEIETTVSNFNTMVDLLSAAGLPYDVYQESKRETWRLGEAEIALDEWPWLNTYIEIEAPSEEAVKKTAISLGLNWEDAVFGGVANLYRHQYPHIGDSGIDVINYEWKSIKFDTIPPKLIVDNNIKR